MNGARLSTTAAKIWLPGLLVLGVAVTFYGSPASGQSLDDFRTAAASDGVNVIPFPDLRTAAVSIADEVERAKAEAGRYDFSLLERQKDNLLEGIQKIEREMEAKQREIEDFEDDHPDGDVTPLEGDLEELEDALSDLQEEVADLNEKTLEPTIEAWRRLADARGGLREAFDNVLDRLDSARSSPEDYLGSDPPIEDVDNLKRYIDVIEDEIELHADTHRDQEEGAKGMMGKYSALLSKNHV